MCRFSLIRSEKNFEIKPFLFQFAQKCRENKIWQGDGWGVAWLDSKNNWQILKSLLPIWEEVETFKKIPRSKIFLIHARSSSFERDKNNLEYNQPFIEGEIAFVFNGNILGMRTPTKIPGKIGSQKIFYLIKKYIPETGILGAIQKVKAMIEARAKKIEGMNLALCDKKKFYLLCYHNGDSDYYGIRYFKTKAMIIVSSEEISDFPFQLMENNQILVI